MKRTISALTIRVMALLGTFFAIPATALAISTEACGNSMDWSDVKNHIGEVVTMKGMLMWAGLGRDVNSPIWLNIGAAYPNKDRVDLLIWARNRSFFPDLIDGSVEGKYLCVRGKVRVYKGIVQIELANPNQVRIAD